MRSILSSLIFLILSPSPNVDATPGTLSEVLRRASSGQRIRLAEGNYGRVALTDRRWSPAIEIDAGEASITFTVVRSEGIVIRNGMIGPATDSGINGRGASLFQSTNIAFDGSKFVGSRVGLVIDQSTNVRVSRASFSGMTADGVDIATSQSILIENSSCKDFIASDRHPDCVQMWSRPGMVTKDVIIRNNVADGNMQGFSAFNHVRGNVNDGGFEGLVITGNTVRSNSPNGVTVVDCRRCSIQGNITSRLPGSRWPVRVRAQNCIECDFRNNSQGL